jgi:hypothetical protein
MRRLEWVTTGNEFVSGPKVMTGAQLEHSIKESAL